MTLFQHVELSPPTTSGQETLAPAASSPSRFTVRPRAAQWIVFAIACGMGLLVSALTGHLLTPEPWEYSEIAANLLSGQGAFHYYLGTKYYFYGPALYPLMLSAVLWISGGREVLMVVLQALLFGATCLMIYQLADHLFDTTTAFFAGVLAALHPGNLVYVGKLHAQTLDTAWMVLSVLILFHITLASNPPRFMKAIGTGLLLGMAALSRGSTIPFCACWAVWWLWRQRVAAKTVRTVALIAVGGALMLAPVLIAGYHRYGRLIPLRTDTGVNVWYGNHPGASGTSYTLDPEPVPVITQITPTMARQLAGRNEVEQHEIFTAAAVSFIRHQPSAAMQLFLRKLWFFWWRSPHTGLLYPAIWTRAYQTYYLVIAWLALIGLAVGLKASRKATRAGTQLIVLLALSASLMQALFYVEGRHRWQLELLFLIFTVAGVRRLLQGTIREQTVMAAPPTPTH